MTESVQAAVAAYLAGERKALANCSAPHELAIFVWRAWAYVGLTMDLTHSLRLVVCPGAPPRTEFMTELLRQGPARRTLAVDYAIAFTDKRFQVLQLVGERLMRAVPAQRCYLAGINWQAYGFAADEIALHL
jgi:hypothetical protein